MLPWLVLLSGTPHLALLAPESLMTGFYWAMAWLALAAFVLAEGLLLALLVRLWRRGAPRRDLAWPALPALLAMVMLGFVLSALPGASSTVARADAASHLTLAGACFVESEASATPPAAYSEPTLTINVTGKPWWWEIEYPEAGFFTAADIYVPAGEVVQLALTGAQQQHRWWTPQTGQYLDVGPERITYLWLRAAEPGTYEGRCLSDCADPRAYMPLRIVAIAPDAFAAWVQQQQTPPPTPDDPLAARGEELMRARGCLACHSIQGISTRSRVGPDLTNMAQRQQIAGVVPYSTATMHDWLIDPAALKPGTTMPRLNMSDEDIAALVAYMDTLK
jgi:cytochrome c oxidase subunit 2